MSNVNFLIFFFKQETTKMVIFILKLILSLYIRVKIIQIQRYTPM